MICMDKNGQPFEVKNAGAKDLPLLAHMYDAFSPKGKYQGLPPEDKEECKNWLKKLFLNGENYLAWREKAVIGHAVLLPDLWKVDAEYLIFVNQFHRGLGVGTGLTQAAIKKAEEIGLNLIWLTVNAYNMRATRLYQKFGFEFYMSYKSRSERMMLYHCRKTAYD